MRVIALYEKKQVWNYTPHYAHVLVSLVRSDIESVLLIRE